MNTLTKAARRRHTAACAGHWLDACLYGPWALVGMAAIVIVATVAVGWLWGAV